VRGAAAAGIFFLLFFFFCIFAFCAGLSLRCHSSAGMKGSGGVLRHLAGLPGGGGEISSCHTILRVHTV